MSTGPLLLDRDPAGRLLPWIVGALTIAVSLTVGVALALMALTDTWRTIGADQVTLRLAGTPPANTERAGRIATRLTQAEGIVSARQLSRSETAALLAPWLGDLADAASDDLPLPHLIIVQLSEPGDIEPLEPMLDQEADVAVDRAEKWLRPLGRLADTVVVSAAMMAVLAIGIILLVTVFSIRAALTAHAPAVELLRVMGAEQHFIARQFQQHNMVQALWGAAAGALVGVGLLMIALGLAALSEWPLLAGATPDWYGWLVLLALPFLISATAGAAARLTVFGLLKDRW